MTTVAELIWKLAQYDYDMNVLLLRDIKNGDLHAPIIVDTMQYRDYVEDEELEYTEVIVID